jgi:hypothetical protein
VGAGDGAGDGDGDGDGDGSGALPAPPSEGAAPVWLPFPCSGFRSRLPCLELRSGPDFPSSSSMGDTSLDSFELSTSGRAMSIAAAAITATRSSTLEMLTVSTIGARPETVLRSR